MPASSWWRAPREFSHQIHDRKISWLEVFSDLVYVAIIHIVTVELWAHWSLMGVATAILAFALIFNSWQNMSWYFDLHGDGSLRTIVLTLLQVLGIGLVALFLPELFAGHFNGLIAAYCLTQILITYLWWSTGHFDPAHRVTSWPYTRIYSAVAGLMLLSLLVTAPYWQMGILVFSMIMDFGAAAVTHRRFDQEYQTRGMTVELSRSILERYGQFTLIVLGEALADMIDRTQGQTSLATLTIFILSMLFVVALWWMYYLLLDPIRVAGNRFMALYNFRLVHSIWLLVLTGVIFFLSYLTEPALHHGQVYLAGSVIVSLWLLIWMARWSPQSNPQNQLPHELRNMFLISVLISLSAGLPVIGQLGLMCGALYLYITSLLRRRQPE